MKKTIAALFASILLTTGAFANENATEETNFSKGITVVPAWVCELSFKGQAKGFQVIIGRFKAKGTGTLRCVSPFEVREIPVKIDLSTKYIAPRVAIGNFKFYGQALSIALLANEPEDLLGRYLVAQGQGAIIGGIGAMTAVHASLPEVALNVSLQFTTGLGINVGLTDMKIKALE